jgi:hypothetical protein
MEIVFDFREFDTYFICKKDCIDRTGFSSIQKCTTTLRILAYGAPGDKHDDRMRVVECTTIECMSRFCMGSGGSVSGTILEITHCRRHCPMMAHNAVRGFSVMLGSIDYMHWKQKKFLFA